MEALYCTTLIHFLSDTLQILENAGRHHHLAWMFCFGDSILKVKQGRWCFSLGFHSYCLPIYFPVYGHTFDRPKLIHSGKGKVTQPLSSRKTVKTYTKAEVSVHNSKKDCWIIIKDKVYDVTPYVEEHPGGDAILTNAGGDATEGFFGPQHATRVFDMVDEFYIGNLQA